MEAALRETLRVRSGPAARNKHLWRADRVVAYKVEAHCARPARARPKGSKQSVGASPASLVE
jgi:hypothetical protein